MPQNCNRCDRAVGDSRDHERHLIEDHCITREQAQIETWSAWGGLGGSSHGHGGHACHRCGAIIECDWRGVAELEEQAHRLKTIAGIWRAKMLGAKPGRPTIHEFDADEARRLIASGMTYRAAAKILNSNPASIHKAVKGLARERTEPE